MHGQKDASDLVDPGKAHENSRLGRSFWALDMLLQSSSQAG
jgi:hypothetical protein